MSNIRGIALRSGLVVFRNPGTSTATLLFAVGFALFSSNAIFSQLADHPAPIWKSQDHFTTQTTSQLPKEVVAVRVQPHKVLIQSISLKNIPVPTANPTKSRSFAAQSSLVREVQATLADVGIYKGKVDGIYGDETRSAILDYQQRAGILPDGEASYSLLGSIKSAFAVAQVKNENKSEENPALPEMIVMDQKMVSSVQSGLKEIYGDDDISVDGIFGNQTREAIRRFQKRFKLNVTGDLDQSTINKLREAGIVGTI
ncbi:MAG: peptidoglycan-binding domain-containing protein [Rhizobiaceae bacterium]